MNNIAVGIGCLVTLGLLAETTGFTEQQQLMEQQRNGKHGFTKALCLALGGKCQDKDQTCDGNTLQGKKYCKPHSKYECCVPKPPPKGCVFGFTTYSHGDYLEEACVEFKCIDGTWNFKGYINDTCGECQASADPHVTTYDNHAYSFAYKFYGKGTYAITQPGCDVHPQYGVKAEFVSVSYDKGASCVKCVNYFEPGIAVDMCIPKPIHNCTSLFDPPDCYITVYVDGYITTIGSGVQQFSGTAGDVLVFEHKIFPTDNLYCINVVGSKGLSVSFCLHHNDYPYTYVLAAPQLKQEPSLLYGLCDTYTGTKRNNYTLRSKDCGNDTIPGMTKAERKTFADSWVLPSP